MVGGAWRRKLTLGSYVNKPISRNLSLKSSSKECILLNILITYISKRHNFIPFLGKQDTLGYYLTLCIPSCVTHSKYYTYYAVLRKMFIFPNVKCVRLIALQHIFWQMQLHSLQKGLHAEFRKNEGQRNTVMSKQPIPCNCRFVCFFHIQQIL